MNVTVVQPDIIWENIEGNLSRLSELIKPLYGSTDIVVLPEMFTTGFTMNTAQMAEPKDGLTYKWMQKVSSDGDLAICGSYIVKESGCFYNRWNFVSPDNSVHYDKRHLFRMGNEETFFTGGKERVIFGFRGVRIMPSICYDLRFPVWSRNNGSYDLLINSANWPDSRQMVWNTLLRARAIENQCYVAASNRVGTDGKGIEYRGDSMILDPKGEVLAKGMENSECIFTFNISMEELFSFREKFPVLRDADDFIINL